MSQVPTPDAIIALFERHRATPGAAFEASYFLDFLLKDPKRKGALRNSFRGKWRFNSFIDEVQLRYGVCFSLSDIERDHSVDTFVERIKVLQKSRRGSLRSLQNQERAGAGWGVVIVTDLMLLGLASAARKTPWLALLWVLAATAVTIAFVAFARRQRAYHRRLRARLEEAGERDDSR